MTISRVRPLGLCRSLSRSLALSLRRSLATSRSLSLSRVLSLYLLRVSASLRLCVSAFLPLCFSLYSETVNNRTGGLITSTGVVLVVLVLVFVVPGVVF